MHLVRLSLHLTGCHRPVGRIRFLSALRLLCKEGQECSSALSVSSLPPSLVHIP